MSTSPHEELEALCVRIYADYGALKAASDSVQKEVDAMEAKFKQLEAVALQASQGIVAVSAGVSAMAGSLGKMVLPASVTTFFGDLSSLSANVNLKPLTDFATHMQGLSGLVVPPTLPAFAQALKDLNGVLLPGIQPFVDSIVSLSSVSVVPDIGPFAAAVVKLGKATALPDIGPFAYSYAAMARAGPAPNIGPFVASLNSLNTKGLPADFSDFVNSLSGLALIGNALPSLQGFADSLRMLHGVDISKSLQSFIPALVTTFGGAAVPSLSDFSNSVRGLHGIAISPATVSLVQALSGLSLITGPLPNFNGLIRLVTALSGGGKLSSITGLVTQLGRMPTSVRFPNFDSLAGLTTSLAGTKLASIRGLVNSLLDLQALTALPDLSPITNWVQGMAGISPQAIENLKFVSSGVGRISRAMLTLSTVNMAEFTKNANGMLDWFKKFNTLTPETVKNIRGTGSAMSAYARFLKESGSIGTALPPVNNAISHNISLAGQAGGKIRSFAGSLRDLFMGATQASNGLNTLRLSLASLAGFSVAVFAKLDDSLVRVMAHMQDWGRESESTLKAAVLGVSSRSITSTQDLAKALDHLILSGMNAAMAQEHLATVEDFAVASGMEAGEAAKELVRLQGALGMFRENAGENEQQMRRLTDVLVGMHGPARTAEKDMISAFSGPFITAITQANMKLEEGVALIGAYRTAGYSAAQASEAAVRALRSVGLSGVTSAMRWRQKFGGHIIFGQQGQRLPVVESLKEMQRVLGHMEESKLIGTLKTLGFEPRAAAALVPLIKTAHVMQELIDKTREVGDVSEKSAEMIRTSFLSVLKNLWQNVKNAAESVGDVLAPALAYVADKLKDLMQWFTNLNPAVKALIVWIGVFFALLAVKGPIIAVFGYLAGLIIGPLISAFSSLFAALASLWPLLLALPLLIAKGILIVLFGLPLLALVFSILGTVFAAITVWIGRIKSAWMDFIPTFRGGLDKIEGFWKKNEGTALSTWDRIRMGVRDFGAEFAKVFERIAGFFWNFKENFAIITAWLGRNWKQLLIDMITNFITFTENLTHNLSALSNYLSATIMTTWSAMVQTILNYYNAIKKWVTDDFGDAVGGLISTILNAFVYIGEHIVIVMAAVFKKLWHSFLREFLSKLIDAAGAVSPLANILNRAFPGISPWAKGQLQAGVGTRTNADIDATMRQQLAGITFGQTDVDRRKLKQTWGRLWGELQNASFFTQNTWGTAAIEWFESWKKFSKDLKSPIAGFVDNIGEALIDQLNLILPGVGTGIQAAWRHFSKQTTLPGEGGELSGKQGPGFQFKQISEARTMVGGAAAETLDYQQLVALRMIQKDTSILAAAAGRLFSGELPVPKFPWAIGE